MTLLEALKYVRDDHKDPRSGICVLVEKVLLGEPDYCSVADEYYEELRRMFRRWPDVHLSWNVGRGSVPDVNYPVGGMGEYHSKDLWANPKRHALLNWLIQELENEE